MTTRISRGGAWLPLAGVLVLAAALRLPTLGGQSLWYDEWIALRLVTSDIGGLFDGLESGFDANPPLYYLVAWLWVKVVGSGDVGLRLVSALAGIATVAVAYLAAAELASRRVGLIASLLVATSPLMVFFSQEARPYALALFLSALSFLFFARALSRSGWRNLAAWVIASALAIATTYLAGVVVVGEALVLFWQARGRRAQIAVAVWPFAAGAIALLPFALAQSSSFGGSGYHLAPLRFRLGTLGEWFSVGLNLPGPLLLLACGGLILGSLGLVLARGDASERRAALLAGAVLASALATAVVGMLIGLDYLVARYLLPLWLPFATLVAVGFGAARARGWGLAAAVTLCAIWLGVGVATHFDRNLRRPDLAGLADGLGPAPAPRLVSLSDGLLGLPLVRYLDHIRLLPIGEHVKVKEVIYVTHRDPRLRPCALWSPHQRTCDRPQKPIPRPPGFKPGDRRDVGEFRLHPFRSNRPGRLHAKGVGVFLQTPG